MKPSHELLERYKRLRAAGLELNRHLAKELPRAALAECGKKLGLYRQGTLVFGSEHEVSVLYEYCLYNFRRGGKNVIERYRMLSPPPPQSTEMVLLGAMLKAYYSLFMATEIHDGMGAELHDVLRDAPITLLDIALGGTMSPGQFIAGRVLPFGEFQTFSGAPIPVSEAVFEEHLSPIVFKFMQHQKTDGSGRLFSPSQEAAFSAQVIRTALQAGAMDNMAYTDLEK